MDDVRFEMLSLGRKGYYCSQIILRLAIEAQGKDDPDLIRAAAGLARGAGSDAGTCGAIIADCYAEAVEILADYGFDVTEPRGA